MAMDKKSFMWELVFMVAVLSRNKLIFVPFYPNILEIESVNSRRGQEIWETRGGRTK